MRILLLSLRWKIEYAPMDKSDEWHPYFCEALKETDYVEYILDVLLTGDVSDRAFLITEGRLLKLREDLNGLDQEQRNKILEVARLLEAEKSASGDCPTWYNATNNSINEVDYCTWFMAKHPLKYVGGIFYDR